jgi:hypothetical protein
MHLNSSNAAGPDERQHRLIRASNGIIPILTTSGPAAFEEFKCIISLSTPMHVILI